jgi:type IV pilus modification protein PilV
MKHSRTAIAPAHKDRGMTMVELMVALTVLAIGVLAVLALITLAMRNNGRTKMDTSGTMVAQMVIETISAQSNPAQALSVTDCNNQVWAITAQDAAAPGAGANITANGSIDFSQAQAAVPNGYRMLYRECGQNGRQITYDVRWNIRTLDAFSRVVTVSARPAGAGNSNSGPTAKIFQAPVTLRTIAVQGN